jgi:hypothetical protein
MQSPYKFFDIKTSYKHRKVKNDFLALMLQEHCWGPSVYKRESEQNHWPSVS